MSASVCKSIAVAVCFGALGAGVAFAFVPGRGEPAPPPRQKYTNSDWLPELGVNQPLDKLKEQTLLPTVFPELAIPDPNLRDIDKREEQLRKQILRLMGRTEITIEPNDDLRRKLLKARLHQGVVEHRRIREVIRIGSWSAMSPVYQQQFVCLADVQATVRDLWGSEPKELIPWLEESVIVAKEMERYALVCVVNGIAHPNLLGAARRHRLKAEEVLLKAKNAK